MKIRARSLPAPWYPETPQRTWDVLSVLDREDNSDSGLAMACVAPHAGWEFSLSIAYAALSSLDPSAETVAVLGGHLNPGRRPLLAREGGVETPLGEVLIDTELRAALESRIVFDEDRFADNTVEIHLPILKFLLPRARVLWVRLPAESSSFEFGRVLAELSIAIGRRTVVVGSTDLTHYGPNYGFSPVGGGPAALKWVREVNDRSFLTAVLASDVEEVLRRGEGGHAACSVGAVLGTMGYARGIGATFSRIVAYGTSADRSPGPSFVGYGSVTWTKNQPDLQ